MGPLTTVNGIISDYCSKTDYHKFRINSVMSTILKLKLRQESRRSLSCSFHQNTHFTRNPGILGPSYPKIRNYQISAQLTQDNLVISIISKTKALTKKHPLQSSSKYNLSSLDEKL